MQHDKTKILFTISLCSILFMVSFFHNIDPNLILNAYGQTPDPSADPGVGTNPSDNSTDAGISTPSDNSTDAGISNPGDGLTNPDNIADPLNQTGSGLSSDVNLGNNNTSSQGLSSTTVPEFGSLVPIILIVATFSIIVLNKVK